MRQVDVRLHRDFAIGTTNPRLFGSSSGVGPLEQRPDLKAIDSKGHPDRVTPRPLTSVRASGDRVEATLAPASWNVIELNVS